MKLEDIMEVETSEFPWGLGVYTTTMGNRMEVQEDLEKDIAQTSDSQTSSWKFWKFSSSFKSILMSATAFLVSMDNLYLVVPQCQAALICQGKQDPSPILMFVFAFPTPEEQSLGMCWKNRYITTSKHQMFPIPEPFPFHRGPWQLWVWGQVIFSLSWVKLSEAMPQNFPQKFPLSVVFLKIGSLWPPYQLPLSVIQQFKEDPSSHGWWCAGLQLLRVEALIFVQDKWM